MLLDTLTIHEASRRLLSSYVTTPKQSILLTGQPGIGLGTIARYLAKDIVNRDSAILTISPDEKGTISISNVRELYVDTRGARSQRQAIVLDDIDAMSHDAQNSFLKLLEEPSPNTFFIMTSHVPQLVLPTILSRTQRIEVRPVNSKESQLLISQNKHIDATKQQQLLFIASGLPAELYRLMQDELYFESKARTVRQARDFLAGKQYDRLVQIGKLTDRHEAVQFVMMLANLIRTTSKREPTLLEQPTVAALEVVTERLAHNGHVRTQMMRLALQLY